MNFIILYELYNILKYELLYFNTWIIILNYMNYIIF